MTNDERAMWICEKNACQDRLRELEREIAEMVLEKHEFQSRLRIAQDKLDGKS